MGKGGGVRVMKDKELNLKEIQTRWNGRRWSPGEREVERLHMILFHSVRHTSSQVVSQKQAWGVVAKKPNGPVCTVTDASVSEEM